MYTCMHAYTCIYTFIHNMYTYLHSYLHVRIYNYTYYLHLFTCIYICTSTFMSGRKYSVPRIVHGVFVPRSPSPYRFWVPDLVENNAKCQAWNAYLVLRVFLPDFATQLHFGVFDKAGYASRLLFTSPNRSRHMKFMCPYGCVWKRSTVYPNWRHFKKENWWLTHVDGTGDIPPP